MALLDPERFWSDPLDRRIEAVRNLNLIVSDVEASVLPPPEALATAVAHHLSDFDPEQDLGFQAFVAWSDFHRDFLGAHAAGRVNAARLAAVLRELDPETALRAVEILRQVAALAEESAGRLRQQLARFDPGDL